METFNGNILIVEGEKSELTSKILVFVNSKSGGQLGKRLIKQLVSVFGEDMVVDILHTEPIGAKKNLMNLAHERNLRLVVCGGDGTVQWVLSDIDALVEDGTYKERPPIAILPLGTGNDLSRQFGWGHGFSKVLQTDLKSSVLSATVDTLDRWNVSIASSSRDSVPVSHKCTMSNYFGIGLDAKIVHNFESCRFVHLYTSNLYKFQ